ncbi:hypothetical protein HMPREF0204_12873 [Chryseobacterium gleum ATCC 35910]|uniref:Uncharacterized protein n=1 Tax=Chryseobacterium gleum ATCC 35910 TaxID=525257 RepID=A0ABN0AL65_CHRGE|nr:hypothetical protein HMPREF0204_12873 [Chryseobacterium gleum ATCC 35910]
MLVCSLTTDPIHHSLFIYALDQMFIMIQDFFLHAVKLYLCVFNNH